MLAIKLIMEGLGLGFLIHLDKQKVQNPSENGWRNTAFT